MGQFMRTCVYEALGCADIIAGAAEAQPWGSCGEGTEKTFHTAATRDLAELQVPAGGTVSQLQQLFRTHDWSGHPPPALSPLVSLSFFSRSCT